ncbi:hypothetical protein LZC95_35050 [Pendulispora brunnea]|uniref:Uncharacterized protein n=1 Tax=Pendulispora brunnea TaxID=2905690 RepID=A0ABZ2K4D9_9BACT
MKYVHDTLATPCTSSAHSDGEWAASSICPFSADNRTLEQPLDLWWHDSEKSLNTRHDVWGGEMGPLSWTSDTTIEVDPSPHVDLRPHNDLPKDLFEEEGLNESIDDLVGNLVYHEPRLRSAKWIRAISAARPPRRAPLPCLTGKWSLLSVDSDLGARPLRASLPRKKRRFNIALLDKLLIASVLCFVVFDWARHLPASTPYHVQVAETQPVTAAEMIDTKRRSPAMLAEIIEQHAAGNAPVLRTEAVLSPKNNRAPSIRRRAVSTYHKVREPSAKAESARLTSMFRF